MKTTKAEIKPSSESTRQKVPSKSKNSAKPEIETRVSVSPLPKPRVSSVPRDTRRPLVVNKPKSGEEVKAAGRVGNRTVVEQFARPTRHRVTDPVNSGKRNEGELDGKKELQEKIEQSESLIMKLQCEVLGLKAELDKAHSLNVELQLHNGKLSNDLAAAESKITALNTRDQTGLVSEYQSPRFKDIQKLIANKLEHSMVKKDAINETKAQSAAAVRPVLGSADEQRKVRECPSAPPPPPPPLPPQPSRPPARAANNGKASAVVKLNMSLPRRNGNKDLMVGGNSNKPIVSSVHNSIVGEIQNRSSHLLAIRSDIETKGELINSLIQKVLAAAYTDIEDVLNFVDWLDDELSSLTDERAVLKHFKWPEKKADAMREAAIEYRSLKLLESEVSSYKDDVDIPCGVALKKMAGLLDKSERSIQRLIKLRNSVMLSYKGHKIPTDWMLDSGIVSKIKQASIMLANIYVKRVTVELESIRYSEKESTQEALLLQGVHFAYRAHQFSGGLDSETLCAFEEIRQRVPGHLQRSRELFVAS